MMTAKKTPRAIQSSFIGSITFTPFTFLVTNAGLAQKRMPAMTRARIMANSTVFVTQELPAYSVPSARDKLPSGRFDAIFLLD